ncbi:MAG TPA: glycosyltransferase family 39 protein, partial [Bacteroidia bacterium]
MFARMKKDNKKKKVQQPAASPAAKKNLGGDSAISAFLGSNNFFYLLLGLVILWVCIVRWRLVGMPLERDEGEYAYIGQQILKGITPYIEAYNMKLPGIYYMYALIMAIFGETYKGIHTGFLIMNAATMLLLFLSLRKFFNPMTGLLTAGFYGLMAITNNVLGFAAHATHFAVFYLSLSLFFFAKYEEKKKWLFALLSGGMLGMAFLMKQQAVYFILFGGILFLVFQFLNKPVSIPHLIKHTCAFTAGVFIPYVIVLIIMLATGAFHKFWFWTVQYAGKYASGLSWSSGKDLLKMTFAPIWNEFEWIWYLAIAGALIVAIARFSLKQKIFALTFIVFAFLATTPGFYFRQHYFIVL